MRDKAGELFAVACIAADRIVALNSGGGSALLPAPAGKLTLADKAVVNCLLLASGFEMTEINLVRQRLSRLKGGGFLRLAAPAPDMAYILSDGFGDDPAVIALGLTVAPIGTRHQAGELLRDRGIWFRLPEPAKDLLRADEADLPLPDFSAVVTDAFTVSGAVSITDTELTDIAAGIQNFVVREGSTLALSTTFQSNLNFRYDFLLNRIGSHATIGIQHRGSAFTSSNPNSRL